MGYKWLRWPKPSAALAAFPRVGSSGVRRPGVHSRWDELTPPGHVRPTSSVVVVLSSSSTLGHVHCSCRRWCRWLSRKTVYRQEDAEIRTSCVVLTIFKGFSDWQHLVKILGFKNSFKYIELCFDEHQNLQNYFNYHTLLITFGWLMKLFQYYSYVHQEEVRSQNSNYFNRI